MIRAILSWLKRTSLGVMLLLPLAAAAQTSDRPGSWGLEVGYKVLGF